MRFASALALLTVSSLYQRQAVRRGEFTAGALEQPGRRRSQRVGAAHLKLEHFSVNTISLPSSAALDEKESIGYEDNVPSSIINALGEFEPGNGFTDVPSTVPSNVSSDSPSDTPSDTPQRIIPTFASSIYPSLVPTMSTSDFPSSIPSDVPSTVPSDVPSSIPSDVPPTIPSDIPSSVPSDVPSTIPSDVPSSTPSDVPSTIPSDVPSSIPSDVPSTIPSDVASLFPSDVPSTIRSDFPSSVPSDLPSTIPSDVPSSIPSSVLYSILSDVPNSLSSEVPSELPSYRLANVPSFKPSNFPSYSSIPSAIPTTTTSEILTLTMSNLPSSLPSGMISVPSDLPSITPSNAVLVTSKSPSRMPSNAASTPPSQNPNRTPNGYPSFRPDTWPTQLPTTKMPTASPLFAPTFTQNEGTCDGDGYTLNPSQATFLAQNDREADKRIVFSYELHLSENATEALIIIESVERRILQAVLGGYCITGDMRRLQVAPVFDSNPPDFPVGSCGDKCTLVYGWMMATGEDPGLFCKVKQIIYDSIISGALEDVDGVSELVYKEVRVAPCYVSVDGPPGGSISAVEGSRSRQSSNSDSSPVGFVAGISLFAAFIVFAAAVLVIRKQHRSSEEANVQNRSDISPDI